MFPKLWQQHGMDGAALMQRLVTAAMQRMANKQALQREYYQLANNHLLPIQE